MLSLLTLIRKGQLMKNILLIALVISGVFAESSLEVAKKTFETISGYGSSRSRTTMKLQNAQGDENIRKMEIRKYEGARGDKSLIVFLYPDDIKGTKLLSYEQIGDDDKQWLYMPELKRVKRISSRNRSGSFMASEFSYEDIAAQHYRNYTYEGKAQDVSINGKHYLKVTRVPVDRNSGYSRQIIYIEPDTYLAKFGEYYDKQDRLLKKVSFLHYKKIAGIYRIRTIKMENVQNRKVSILIWDEDEIDAGLRENAFSKRALK